MKIKLTLNHSRWPWTYFIFYHDLNKVTKYTVYQKTFWTYVEDLFCSKCRILSQYNLYFNHFIQIATSTINHKSSTKSLKWLSSYQQFCFPYGLFIIIQHQRVCNLMGNSEQWTDNLGQAKFPTSFIFQTYRYFIMLCYFCTCMALYPSPW